MLDVETIESQWPYHDLREANASVLRLRQMIALQESERGYLARELHDDVGQLLTLVKINASAVLRHLMGEQEQRQAALIKVLDEALGKVRNFSSMLGPANIGSSGLIAAMHRLVERIPSDSPGVCVRLKCTALEPRPDSCTEVALFRIFQEALSNVLKHGGASMVEVRLSRRKDGIHLMIVDNGCGFDSVAVLQNSKGMGLMNMAERARLLVGKFTLHSDLDRGTRIEVVIPDSAA